MRVDRYTADHAQEWNDFVRHSKNGVFLFDRGYMDYHRDRFADASLLVHDDRGRLIAVLPASRHENALVSHGGLTYGGFVTGSKMTTRRMLDVFDTFIGHIRQEGVERDRLQVRAAHLPLGARRRGRLCLFVHDAQLVRRDISSAIDTRRTLPRQDLRLRVLQRARKAGLRVEQSEGFGGFWPVLERNLEERHATKPVHTLEEITLTRCEISGEHPALRQHSGRGAPRGCRCLRQHERLPCPVQRRFGRRPAQGALDLVLAHVIERFRRRIDGSTSASPRNGTGAISTRA